MRIGLGISVSRGLEWVVPILVDLEDRLKASIEGRDFGKGVEEVVLGVEVISSMDSIRDEEVEFHEEVSIEVYGEHEQVKRMLVLNVSLAANDDESIDAEKIQRRFLREVLAKRAKVEGLRLVDFHCNDFFTAIQSIEVKGDTGS
ncbi:hypothetical protein [Marilutibacter spongiae]|uniref:Uncharacterized protein n=1 Tax=Marilutibacter spongiae TaxID=2025720 RepID=A0A7W3TP81_9GAMM|nr:hypothetical protein [Lysobacter spongiae]MBB1061945.1 hypothetical protein [Lysobacter spongiae]